MQLFNNPLSNSYARMTGLFYLLIAFMGPFAILYVPSVVLIDGDAAATAAAIAANKNLMMWGITGEFFIITAELFATTMLFFMFKPVNAALSLVAAFARLSMAIIMAVMLFFSAIALNLVDGGASFTALGEDQRAEMALLFMQAHEFGVVIWQVFFCVHLLMLGGLVVRSGRFPRILGWAMQIGALGYLLDSINVFMFPGNDVLGGITAIFLTIVIVGEFGFALWLVIKGQKQLQGAAA